MSISVSFTAPPPGFAPEIDFTMSAVEGAEGLYSLLSKEHSGDTGGLRIFVLDAAVYLPSYQPDITEEQRLQLGLTDAADAQVLIVANSTEAGTTVNLLAPIVLNTRTNSCAQVILEGQDWPVRIPLDAVAA
ncbi:flagellar assembly protein FliW [Arthrobacter sp. ATA002]|uniref:flagellar assembly protein FliW n=1 Tax=Arthrobacter sp. ATA002 TaxID=2991715 RepID=UPI0022A8096A|nr:flagellar assembly protein FliW [Arthrobacter sp. ATA002]WAP51682.1 flagellar assembly protein FliW [Arthrobacter sp. ATA002]